MKKNKSKAQVYVEQANNYLMSIGTFQVGAMVAARVDQNGNCALYDRNLSQKEALELGLWLIETFMEKDDAE